MSVRLFEGKAHAQSYWKYRISPSQEIIDMIINFLHKHRSSPQELELAVDVGCGSGQGTVLLAPHFTRVVGTDVSPAQLEMATQHATAHNITYRESPAEQLPLEDASVDLVTAMSAFHWFDHAHFLQEADRVLKPRGCLALLNYTLDMELSYPDADADTLNAICKELFAALTPYRNPYLGATSMDFYKKAYDTITYSIKEWHESMWLKKTVPLSSFIGMIESFSPYQAMLQQHPEKAKHLSHDITHRLMKTMGVSSPDTEVLMSVRYYCMLACKP
ncbi:putative methyltransferase DDB_G0268948 isoform X1 [Engraulis encrasicolus]|uniref:putative methyltransferase DDB_G0268948 isoform X1 n=1 Tax=Engraulis encrasicolus TaxID=184585 RepID=UPI002FD00B8A